MITDTDSPITECLQHHPNSGRSIRSHNTHSHKNSKTKLNQNAATHLQKLPMCVYLRVRVCVQLQYFKAQNSSDNLPPNNNRS